MGVNIFMKSFAVSLYTLSLLVQISAVVLCFTSFTYLGKFRSGWIFLASGATLMAGRRIFALLTLDGVYLFDMGDSVFSLLISILLMLGILNIRHVFKTLEQKNIELEKLNSHDHLTQALSRFEILKRLDTEIERAERFNHPLTLLEIDIDHFKKINDEFGHQAGDEVLQSLSQCCRQTLRVNDCFGRIGGEEFLILLPETSQSQAFDAAERVRQVVASTAHLTSTAHPVQITVSVGVASFNPANVRSPDKPLLAQKLLKRADEAMYQAKKAGRNRVAVYSCPEDTPTSTT